MSFFKLFFEHLHLTFQQCKKGLDDEKDPNDCLIGFDGLPRNAAWVPNDGPNELSLPGGAMPQRY